MSERSEKNAGLLLTRRNIWLYTFAALVIVLVGWIHMMTDDQLQLQPEKWLEAHRLNPVIIFFDLLPVYILVILFAARRRFLAERREYRQEFTGLKNVLDRNTSFATALSEGEDPEVFDNMLNHDIGRALKLIHLNIKSNRRKEKEITWITEGKDMISRILRMYDQIDELSYQILRGLSRYIGAIQGAAYLYDEEEKMLENVALLAYNRQKFLKQQFRIGQGLVGQCAYEMDYIYRTEIPDDYVTITSGILGDRKPKSIVLIPLITNEQLQGVMEFAFFEPRINKLTIQFLLELGEIIARTIFNLRINERTRLLLEESRKMTGELRKNEQVLQENADEMKATQDKLQQANEQLQKKIEEAQLATNRLYWLLENASEIISIYDRDRRLTYISPSVQNILGYSTSEMMSGKDFERMDQRGTGEIMKSFDWLLENPGEVAKIEYTYLKKDGHRTYLQSTIRNRLEDPSISGFIFNTRDVSETKLIEKEQRLKTRMQSLSENSLDMILRLNTEGLIHYANPVVEDYTGIPPGSMTNRLLGDIPLKKDISEIISGALHRISENPVKFNVQESIAISMGEKISSRILQLDVIPEFQEGEVETILLVGHDITEAKRIESEIKVSSRKIRDSIQYAERIQSSLLPGIADLKKVLPGSFIFYEPREAISGDFPWFAQTEEALFVAGIDCTGHGVPGALLSFISFFLLNNLTSLHPGHSTGIICDMLSTEVRKTLKQDRSKPDTRDGMDLALVKISKDLSSLEFTGAHRPLYLLREGELTVYKGDRMAIGGIPHRKDPGRKFTTHSVELRKGDKIFFFSDGLTDQLGGPEGLKYSPARIRRTLVENPGFTIQQFHEYFREDFALWKGTEVQLDDVLMIGIGF